MLPTLTLGPLVLPVPAFLLLIGVWLGITLSEKFAHTYGTDRNQLSSLVSFFLAALVIGSRASFIARYPGAFMNNWLSVLSPNLAMFDWTGGFLIGLLVAAIFISRRQLDVWKTLDSLTPAILTFLFALGLSYLASGQYYGVPTRLPWGIPLWGALRHPTQVYWLLWMIGIAILLWPRPRRQWFPGFSFLILLLLLSIGMGVIEYFRADSQSLLGGLRIPQLYAFLALCFSLWQMGNRIRDFQLIHPQEVQNGSDFHS